MIRTTKNDKTMDYCDFITHKMTSYITNFILQTFHDMKI